MYLDTVCSIQATTTTNPEELWVTLSHLAERRSWTYGILLGLFVVWCTQTKSIVSGDMAVIIFTLVPSLSSLSLSLALAVSLVLILTLSVFYHWHVTPRTCSVERIIKHVSKCWQTVLAREQRARVFSKPQIISADDRFQTSGESFFGVESTPEIWAWLTGFFF